MFGRVDLRNSRPLEQQTRIGKLALIAKKISMKVGEIRFFCCQTVPLGTVTDFCVKMVRKTDMMVRVHHNEKDW